MGDRFRAYLDDELTPAERAAFEAEVAASPALGAEFEDYRRTVELLRALPAPEPPERFAERVEGRIRRRSRGRYFSLDTRLRLPYEATIILALLATMLVMFLSAAPIVERPPLAGPCAEPAVAAELERVAAALTPWGDVTARADCRVDVVVAAAKATDLLQALGRGWPAWVVERVGETETGAVRFLLSPGPREPQTGQGATPVPVEAASPLPEPAAVPSP